MSSCIVCNQAAGRKLLTFRALEVQTLPIRDIGGERKVQALGSFHEFCVCENCAKARKERNLDVGKTIRKKMMCFGAVSVAGILLIVADILLLRRDRVFFMLGLFAVLCGILGCVQSYREAKQKRDSLNRMKEEEAVLDSAWELVVEHAPKKDGDQDLTYIPVTKKTLSYKNGDIMIAYNLLPEIAVEAHKRIHS
ncbi:MAG: hypothetical protein IJ899_17465 [Blautia sp.]|nr:hypothetical protein [Blautia sp.]